MAPWTSICPCWRTSLHSPECWCCGVVLDPINTPSHSPHPNAYPPSPPPYLLSLSFPAFPWGHLGTILGHLGAILGHLTAIPGPSWSHIGPPWFRKSARRDRPVRISYKAFFRGAIFALAPKVCREISPRENEYETLGAILGPLWVYLVAILVASSGHRNSENW